MQSMNARKSILMAYVKGLLFSFFVFTLCGCSGLTSNTKIDKDFETGYRRGVKENIHDFAQNFYGNDFPYFNWVSPVIQNVYIPAHIENGLFISAHFEPVMIEPGQWRNKLAYPVLSSDKKRVQTEGGNSYAVKYVNFNLGDITVLPASYAGNDSRDKEKNYP